MNRQISQFYLRYLVIPEFGFFEYSLDHIFDGATEYGCRRLIFSNREITSCLEKCVLTGRRRVDVNKIIVNMCSREKKSVNYPMPTYEFHFRSSKIPSIHQ